MIYPATIYPLFFPRSKILILSNPCVTNSPGPPLRSAGRLDLSALDPSVQLYFQNGLAPSTQRTYATAMKQFHTFCTMYNVNTPFPLSEQLLCSFAAYLAD